MCAIYLTWRNKKKEPQMFSSVFYWCYTLHQRISTPIACLYLFYFHIYVYEKILIIFLTNIINFLCLVLKLFSHSGLFFYITSKTTMMMFIHKNKYLTNKNSKNIISFYYYYYHLRRFLPVFDYRYIHNFDQYIEWYVRYNYYFMRVCI